MSAPVAAPVPSAVCPGDPETFASEMIKMINDKEFRFAKLRVFVCLHDSCLHFTYSDIRFVVGEERKTVYAHKCLLAARFAVTVHGSCSVHCDRVHCSTDVK